MTLRNLQIRLGKRLLPSSTRELIQELIFDGGLWIATLGDHGAPLFSTLLQCDGDAITQLNLDAPDDAANIRPAAERHMRAVELQLDTLLRPLRRVEQAAAAGVFIAWAGSVTAAQQVLEWAGIAQAPAPDPFSFLEWSWIAAAAWAVGFIPLLQRLWPHVRRYALHLALRRLVTLAGD